MEKEVRLENEMASWPSFSEMQFYEPYLVVVPPKMRIEELKQYDNGTSGIYLIKVIETDFIVKIGFHKDNLIGAVNKALFKIVNTHAPATNLEVAFLKVPIHKSAEALQWYRYERRKISIDTNHALKLFLLEKINKEKSRVHLPALRAWLQFYPPFNGSNGKKKVCSFKRSIYEERSGVYFIKENDEIVYVGMSNGKLYRTLYHHFYRYIFYHGYVHNDKFWTPPYRADYSDRLDLHTYEVALIDIPIKGSIIEHGTYIRELERDLIEILTPRDNVMHNENHSSESTDDETDVIPF